VTSLPVYSPFDGRQVGDVALLSSEQCLAALDLAHETALARDAWLPPHERIGILERLAALMHERRDALALTAASEGGKPLRDSRVEVERAIVGVMTAIAELHHLGGAEVPMGLPPASAGRVAMTYREPRGVVLAISAFNHPVNLVVHQVVPAVAVGAPVLVKPSADTPLSCQAIVSMLHEAGLPRPWAQTVVCSNEDAQRLAEDARLGFLSFIGSPRVGWMLRSRLAPGVACALEHGGVAPVVVDPTADLDEAAALLTFGGTYHAGQVCVSVQRIYAHDEIKRELTERLATRIRGLRVGAPDSEDTDVGPLIRPREVQRVASWVDDAQNAGARLVAGGEATSDTCYQPTLLLDPPDDAKVSREEVFGPVLSVYGYRELDHALTRANAPDSYFQAAVFTKRLDVALRAHRRLHGMSVMVNDHTAFRADWMPFGGHRRSGLGVGGIGPSMREMSLERMLVIRSGELL